MQPIIKWAGGKRRFSRQIAELLGNNFNNYFEPFVGGAAILLYMEPHNAQCSDINEELINLYNVVKNDPEGLITELKPYVNMNNSANYLTIRGLDRVPVLFNALTPVQKAARFMYLNHTCFNGIWRVNRNGQNNVPFGRYVNPKILAEDEIRQASQLFNANNISFEVNDYRVVANRAQAGDVVYFDPPYDVEEGQNGFVGYTASGFNRDNQRELKELCDDLIRRGVTVGISNSNTKFIRELYSDDPYHFYQLHDELRVRRTIGAKNESRREMTELFILGRLPE